MLHAQASISIAAVAVLLAFASNVTAQASMPYIGLDDNGNLHVNASEPPGPVLLCFPSCLPYNFNVVFASSNQGWLKGWLRWPFSGRVECDRTARFRAGLPPWRRRDLSLMLTRPDRPAAWPAAPAPHPGGGNTTVFVDGVDVQARVANLESTVESLESTIASLESTQAEFNAHRESVTQDINALRAALTLAPTQPTAAPTMAPSVTPSLSPTSPTSAPTAAPSATPSVTPTIYGYLGTATVSPPLGRPFSPPPLFLFSSLLLFWVVLFWGMQ